MCPSLCQALGIQIRIRPSLLLSAQWSVWVREGDGQPLSPAAARPLCLPRFLAEQTDAA